MLVPPGDFWHEREHGALKPLHPTPHSGTTLASLGHLVTSVFCFNNSYYVDSVYVQQICYVIPIPSQTWTFSSAAQLLEETDSSQLL